ALGFSSPPQMDRAKIFYLEHFLVRRPARYCSFPADVGVDYYLVNRIDWMATTHAKHQREVSKIFVSGSGFLALPRFGLYRDGFWIVGGRNVVAADILATSKIFYRNTLLIGIDLVSVDVGELFRVRWLCGCVAPEKTHFGFSRNTATKCSLKLESWIVPSTTPRRGSALTKWRSSS